MESCRSVFLAILYSVMTRPQPVRCGKWPGPVSAGQGCAIGLLFAEKINMSRYKAPMPDLFGFAVINHVFRRRIIIRFTPESGH